jgi:hypothetical protein
MSIEAQKQIRENTMVLSTFYLLPFVLLFLQCLSYDDVAECFYALVLLNAESLCQFSAETCNIVHAFARKQCVENTSAGFSRRVSFFLSLLVSFFSPNSDSQTRLHHLNALIRRWL